MRSFAAFVATAVAIPMAIAAPNKAWNSDKLDAKYYSPEQVMDVDVVIIGAGGMGAYSAIQLKDAGKKVVVVESKDRCGGHTETYHDKETGIPIDMGVKLYHDEPLVYQWFARFNLSTTFTTGAAGAAAGPNLNVDFRTGQVIPGLPAANQTAIGAAIARYAAIISQWPQLEGGFYLPEPIPEDLLMPFGQFVQKYQLTDAVQTIYVITSAFGDVLEIPTLQVIRTFGLGLIKTMQNFQTSSVNDNSLLFERLTAELLASNSLLLSSKVTKVARVSKIDGGVKVLVETPKGCRLIQAKKILMAIPPTPENLQTFDPSGDELKIFSQFTSVGYFTSIIRHAAPNNTAVNNLAIDRPYAVPAMPAVYNILPTSNPTLSLVYYGTKVGQQISTEQAKAAIMADINRFRAVNNVTGPAPEFVAFANHAPYNLMVGAEATRAGFYKSLYGLQAKRNTFWTGAAFRAHDSSSSWAFTSRSVLPQLLASLQ
ncbi:hypothetical protein HBH56_174770 [Parastagonospora nodorum]|uniref:Amine oxidase domain-containing protein n=2 Tax=Phaeosphaeria nodorum (strain SN15 / ATCC MYA-4574 / FGSC 10173) TaxID=321614 RepID=A0A7U2F050_PHANO|nr:hypothetical protein SNOG_01257 [Parastagonospora nodorum SN15]KAH3908418.1 hypothetical protein HBH56_174770 [Parastagonospora nodorum]EAT90906.1 hypothetical protein SNOG_01257 [Parastagonospora nodorum SN15]KAH3926474.1 hypothetical protein HBH54_168380 [Parastagonospora nodorum]KAH4007703.1 hypothetical protein HBI10_008790 [Parastagonospora nodorum]KAH4023596.1 hypothetical protein HBI13_090500 [Parastagonospora nodorum]